MLETDSKDGKVLELQPEVLGELRTEDLKFDTKKGNFELQTNGKDERAELLKIKIIFLLLGILSLLPWNIVLNAEGFFRERLTNTYFEENFSLCIQAMAVFSNLFGSIFMFYLSKKFSVRKIVLVSTITFSAPLIVVTALAKIDTESWQEEFFVIFLVVYSINAVSHGLITSSHSILSSMIHAPILKTYYVGKGLAGLAGSAVALSTLASPTVDVVGAAFYYFLIMTILTFVGAMLLTIYLLRMDLVKERTTRNYKVEAEYKKTEEKTLPLKEIASIIKTQCISVFLVTVSSLLVFPATLTNLESVNPSSGTDWSDKFYLPVSVFLVWTIGDNAGKILTEFVNWPRKEVTVWFSIVRLVVVPLTLMTNITPRTIPVWFKSDVIPSIICFITSFSGGYLVNLNLNYAPGYFEGKENKGRASMVLFFFLATGLALGSGSIFLIPVIINS